MASRRLVGADTSVRLAGPASAMLPLVFLRQGDSSSSPPNAGLVLVDQVDGLAYLLAVALLVLTILTPHWMRVDAEANAGRAIRLDRLAAGGMFRLFVIGTAILLAPAL